MIHECFATTQINTDLYIDKISKCYHDIINMDKIAFGMI